MRAFLHRQPQHKRPRSKILHGKLLIIIVIIMTVLLAFGCVLLILSSLNIIPGYWSTIIAPIFLFAGVLLPLITWAISLFQSRPEPLPLASDLERTNTYFNLGDNAAATFPYVKIQEIQELYEHATQALEQASTRKGNKNGILILGEASLGKTRMAFEVLTQTLPSWPVLTWSTSSKLEEIPQLADLKGPGLVLFIDDLQGYTNPSASEKVGVADTHGAILKAMISRTQSIIGPVVIVATCRSEDERRAKATLGNLWEQLEVISVPSFNSDKSQSDKIIAAFQEKGSIHIDDWDGTLGSLVLGLSTKTSEYQEIHNDPAETILQAMKLLTFAGVTDHTEQRVQGVCAGVFDKKVLQESKSAWRSAVASLIQLQFISTKSQESGKISLVIRKDAYFEQVIDNYPPPGQPYERIKNLTELVDVFMTLKDAEALIILGATLFQFKKYDKVLEATEKAIQLDLNMAPTYLALAYNNKAAALVYLQQYREAVDAADRAIQLDPNLALAHSNKASALVYLQLYQEAVDAADRAIQLDPNLALAYNNKAAALVYLQQYREAIDAANRAMQLDPSLPQPFMNKIAAFVSSLQKWPPVIKAIEDEHVSLQKNIENFQQYEAGVYVFRADTCADSQRYDEALDAYESALTLDPSSASAWSGKAKVLRTLGREEEAQAAEAQAEKLTDESQQPQ
jgi:tetratricopeptide (TPR) repeat protein